MNKSQKISYFVQAFLFIVLLIYIFFYGIGDYGLLAKDEPRYAGCALEMLENKNWIVPKFNFQDRFDKPALFYWLIASAYKILGVSEFSSRVPSALCAILLVLFTWYIGSKVLGKKTGLLSAIILATSVEYIFLGRRAATDIVLCFFFSTSLYSMYLGYFIKDWKIKIFWTVLSGLFCGLAILTKGPIGLVLLLGILTVFLICRKQFDIKHLRVYFIISFIALIINLPWYIMVHNATKGAFTQAFFFTHNLQRFTSVVGEHPGPIWFYIPVILVGFMPWTLFFLYGLFNSVRGYKRKHFNKFILFCLIWTFIIFFFFTFCKTKMATYILLLFPPLSLITGYWLNILGKKYFKPLKYVFIFLLLVLILTSIVLIFLIPTTTLYEADKNPLIKALFFLFCIFMLGILLLAKFSHKSYSLIYSFVFLVMIPFIYVSNVALSGYYRITFSELRDYAKLARQQGASEIISFGGYKPILVYYGRIPVDFDPKPKQIKKIKKLLSQNKEVYIIGYLSDLDSRKPIVIKNVELLKKLKILDSGRKYFLGKFSF